MHTLHERAYFVSCFGTNVPFYNSDPNPDHDTFRERRKTKKFDPTSNRAYIKQSKKRDITDLEILDGRRSQLEPSIIMPEISMKEQKMSETENEIQNSYDHNHHYPFSGLQARFMFILLVVFSIFIVIDTCYDLLQWNRPNLFFSIEAFLLLIGGGVISFSLANDFSDFAYQYVLLIITFSTIVVHIMFFPSAKLYLISLIIINFWALLASKPSIQNAGGEGLLMLFYIIWVVTGVVITLGDFGYLPYYGHVSNISDLTNFERLRAIIDNPKLRILLDIRYLLSTIMVFLLAGVSFWETCRVPAPRIQRLPLFTPDRIFRKSDSIIHSILFPFLLVTSAILKVVHSILDTLWRILAVVCFYLYQFTSKFVSRIYSYIINRNIWRGLLKVFGSFSIIIIFSHGVTIISKDIYKYLLSSYTIKESISLMYPILLRIAIFFIVALLLLSSYRALWRGLSEWRKSLDHVVMFGAAIVLALTLTGFLSHIATWIGVFPLKGFDNIGPFFLIMATLMVVLAVYTLILRLSESKASN